MGCGRRESQRNRFRRALHPLLQYSSNNFLQSLRAASVCPNRRLPSFPNPNRFSCTFRRRDTPGRLWWIRTSPLTSSSSCAHRSDRDLSARRSDPPLLRRGCVRREYWFGLFFVSLPWTVLPPKTPVFQPTLNGWAGRLTDARAEQETRNASIPEPIP